MSIRDFSGESGGNRSGADRERHFRKCQEAIRKGFSHLVAQQDIIGNRGPGKKATLRINAFPEYRFGFSKKHDGGVGFAAGRKRGDQFHSGSGNQGSSGGPGGNAEGEDVYEIEVTTADLDEFLFEDLELPDLITRKLRQVPVVDQGGMTGICRHGPLSRLHRRGSVRQRVRREQAEQSSGAISSPGFMDDDLRFRRMSERLVMSSSAVLFCVMDVSGSMDDSKKFLSRVFFWLLNRFIQSRYEHAEVVFVTHHSSAREVSEDDFFHTRESGGTIISSAYELVLDIIRERFSPDAWNIYVFHISDGDNWADDTNGIMLDKARELLEVCNLFGYGQVDPESDSVFGERSRSAWSTVFEALGELRDDYNNLGLVRLTSKEDVYPAFRDLMLKEKQKGAT